jgi:hypothetical protein
MRGKSIPDGHVNTPKIIAPPSASSGNIRNGIEKLLVPAQGAEELRGEFVFSFNVIGERVGVADPRNLKANLVKLRPKLKMVIGITDILANKKLMIIADVFSGREPDRIRSKINPFAA